jgi:hypothetical protein
LDKHFGLGFKLSVINPQLKVASDGKLALIVTEPSNLIVQKIQNADTICRFCFKGKIRLGLFLGIIFNY